MSRNQTPAAIPSSNFRSTLTFAALSLATMSLAAAAILWQPHIVAAQTTTTPSPATNTVAFYTQSVLPILQTNCYRCHGGLNHRGGLNISTKAGLLRGGHDGAVIVPGNSEQSLLIKLIRHEGPVNDPMPMPPKPRPKISDADIATIAQWIQAGAVMPPDSQ